MLYMTPNANRTFFVQNDTHLASDMVMVTPCTKQRAANENKIDCFCTHLFHFFFNSFDATMSVYESCIFVHFYLLAISSPLLIPFLLISISFANKNMKESMNMSFSLGTQLAELNKHRIGLQVSFPFLYIPDYEKQLRVPPTTHRQMNMKSWILFSVHFTRLFAFFLVYSSHFFSSLFKA